VFSSSELESPNSIALNGALILVASIASAVFSNTINHTLPRLLQIPIYIYLYCGGRKPDHKHLGRVVGDLE
jgi:hypothetical protein